jgi:hypothetical protein
MRSPFVRKGKRSFANGLNTNEERSVWIGGTTLVVGQGRRNDSSQDKFPWQSSNGSETSSTNQSSSTSRGLFSLSTGYNNNNDNAAQNHRRQQQNKSRWMERIKALSPRKEKDSRKEKDADEDDDDDVFFFSPDSNPPEGASKSRLPENHEKMKRRLSVSIGGETIIGADVSLSTSSLSSNHYRTRRTNGRNNARRRKRRNSSSNNSYYPLFGSITSVDIPSRALTLSSLDDATEENRDGESARAGEQEVVDDLEAASNISRNGEDDFCEEEEEVDDCYDSFSYQTTPSRVGSKRKIKSVGQQKRVSTTEGRQSSLCDDRHQRESGVKRRRLSKRARTRLTMREVNTHIQPGRHYSALDSMGSLERRKAITLPKTIDFFRRIEIKLIAVNTLVSVALTTIVLHLFPDSWKTSLEETSPAVSLLGAFLSFTLVFRTQTCYHRWWEARTQWGRMTSVCVNLAGQANAWFVDDELIDRFLTHCIVFPYACKAVLRCNELNSSSEEGVRILSHYLLCLRCIYFSLMSNSPAPFSPLFCSHDFSRAGCLLMRILE